MSGGRGRDREQRAAAPRVRRGHPTAVRQSIREIDWPADRLLVIGADSAGRLLEVVVIEPDSDLPAVMHAMRLRPKFYRYL